MFNLSSETPDDFGMWPPPSPVRGSVMSAPAPLSWPQVIADAGPTSEPPPAGALDGGGVTAAQEAADALVDFVQRHPELRGRLWSRLRGGFAGCD